MRIGIYNPYLDTLGGGELYSLSIGTHLSKINKVDIFWDDINIRKRAGEKFNLDLSKLNIVSNIFSANITFFERLRISQKYDVIIVVSDGSIPLLFSRKTILIFQFPVNWIKRIDLINRIKLQKIDKIICYTNFVKEHLARIFDQQIGIIYPPVDQIGLDQSEKKNVILTVGRFTKAMNAKKQEVLLNTFMQMVDKGLRNWKLAMIGSYLPNDADFIEELNSRAAGYPVEIIGNATHQELVKTYKIAKIYWHAAGYGENLIEHPEKAEHFGISTVEAMSAGCVPIVIKAGGQKEIVRDTIDGYMWETVDQLWEKTEMLIKQPELLSKLSLKAIDRAKFFNPQKFNQKIEELLL